MKCGHSSEQLALYVEGDLPPQDNFEVMGRLADCGECRQFLRQIEESQSVLKSFREQTVTRAALHAVRAAALTQIHDGKKNFGWPLRLERLVFEGFRRHRYALAGVAIAAVVSATLLGQIRHRQTVADVPSAGIAGAVFDGKDTLLRPEGYREWVFVGSSVGLSYAENPTVRREGPGLFHNVYMNPTAFREYARTGRFPDGTVMVLEIAKSETKKEPGLQGAYATEFLALEASVKDSRRFEGGWGYFNFTDNNGQSKTKAQALGEKSGCRACHAAHAETDQVFTQFYPILRAAAAKS